MLLYMNCVIETKNPITIRNINNNLLGTKYKIKLINKIVNINLISGIILEIVSNITLP